MDEWNSEQTQYLTRKYYEIIDHFKALQMWAGMFLLSTVSECHAMLVLSAATNDVYIGICEAGAVDFKNSDWITNTTQPSYNDRIAIITFCQTGAVNLLVPLNKAFYVKFELRDMDGKEVEKTDEGRQWGSDIGNFPNAPGRDSRNRMASWRAIGPHTNGFSAYMTGLWTPAPDELFKMTNAGVYNLTLEVQLMKQHMISGGWTWDHISIPPISVNVLKP